MTCGCLAFEYDVGWLLLESYGPWFTDLAFGRGASLLGLVGLMFGVDVCLFEQLCDIVLACVLVVVCRYSACVVLVILLSCV